MIDFNDLGSLSNPNANTGAMEIDINLIDEDPNQPRTIFDDDTLLELAETIKDRGVKSPISVHRIDNGRYMVNHGARRLRASKLAGKTTIPAFIDNDYSKIDQIIENIQRDNLSPMDIAKFIQSEKDRGLKQCEIANELGKKDSWVCVMYSLLSLCPAIKKLYEQNRFDSATSAVELNRLYLKYQNEVEAFIQDINDDSDAITVRDVRKLKQAIKDCNSLMKDSALDKLQVPNGSQEVEDKSSESENKPEQDFNNKKNTDTEVINEVGSTTSNNNNDEDTFKSLDALDDIQDCADECPKKQIFKTVKEIHCKCDTYGSVSVVFRKAEQEGFIVILTDDGVKEIAAHELNIESIVF